MEEFYKRSPHLYETEDDCPLPHEVRFLKCEIILLKVEKSDRVRARSFKRDQIKSEKQSHARLVQSFGKKRKPVPILSQKTI